MKCWGDFVRVGLGARGVLTLVIPLYTNSPITTITHHQLTRAHQLPLTPQLHTLGNTPKEETPAIAGVLGVIGLGS